MKIGFIGLGNMASAILRGVLNAKLVAPEEMIGYAATEKTREKRAKEFGIKIGESNKEVALLSDIIVLAVKPHILPGVIEEIDDAVSAEKLIVTVAAGKNITWYIKALGKERKIVRCMPNTPALVGAGCTAVCFHPSVEKEERETVVGMLTCLGQAYEIPERMMDIFGAVAGSSPAYVFMFIEALADAAVAGGIPRAQAYEFAGQAVLGSAKLLLESGKHPGELKDMVCSPAGTTIQAVRMLEKRGLRAAVMDAVDACVKRTKEL